MEDLNDKILGGNLAAPEWNQLPSEVQNVIEQTGQTLTNADLNQLGKSIANYVGSSNFYTDNGIANAYALSNDNLKQPITDYTVGLTVEFIPTLSNTTASTVNVATLGVINILTSSGGAISSGDIFGGRRIVLKYDGADFLIDNAREDFSPVGSIKTWPTVTSPSGYLECDGTLLSETQFSSLFNVIGIVYGTTGSSDFALPDLRGEFIRGWNHSSISSNDPDADLRTDSGIGGGEVSGDTVGTKQFDEIKAHIHGIETVDDTTGGSSNLPLRKANEGNETVSDNTEPAEGSTSGGLETRPRNVYMMYIIKF